MLTNEQYKILKKLLKNDIPRHSLYHHGGDNSVMEYLSKNYFITEYTSDYYSRSIKRTIQYCKITEEGKVEFKICKENKYRFWIPTIISIIALLISILSIYAKPLIWTYTQETFFQSDDANQ